MPLNAAENPYENPDLEPICIKTAETIGGAVTPERVRNVIEASNVGRHILHGVKENKDVPEVLRDGVQPLTPEGGYASYWASGTKIFMHKTGEERYTTYDTAFFHYGHSNDPDKKHVYMTIAITRGDQLPYAESQKITDDAYVSINVPLPKDKLHILRVELDKGETNLTDRQYGQLAEQKMFELIEEALTKGYKPGKEKVVKITAGKDFPAAA